MKLIKNINYLLVFCVLALSISCKTRDDLQAFKDAKYSLAGIDQLHLNGVSLLDKKRPEDFNFAEAAMLFSAVSDNKLAANSTLGLNVELEDGSKERSMTVTQLKWQLLLNGKQTLSGLVNEPVELRNGLNTLSIKTPVLLAEENGRPDFNNLLGLLGLLNNQDKSKRPEVVLQIKPTIQTSVGPVEFPSFINIRQ
ncbi:hypothetical protein [Pontibacter ruber]|uniref:Late embryogenesis abundant protein n=1 Tax=Pontibacter ruber TaxID=1343895 RepID=A0ABW5CUM9_9BACT|nr:hypothetical protein [Pontibacter ruber]